MPCHPSEPEFHVRDIPNLRGYVVIVTGGNSGIGFETTLQLALRGARVYIASRSSDRVNKAIEELRQNSPDLDLHFLKLDLQDIQTIKETAADFMSRENRLDILINNAGIMASPWQLTKDGHEVQWQTCFLSHHALTMELMPLLVAAAQASGRMDRARIVNVASDMALGMGPETINYEDPNLTTDTGRLAPWRRYGHCKEANIIAARAITDRYQALGVTAYSLHPGIVKTGLQSHNPSKVFQMLDHRANKWLDDPQAVNKLWDLATRQLKEHGFHIEDIPRYYY